MREAEVKYVHSRYIAHGQMATIPIYAWYPLECYCRPATGHCDSRHFRPTYQSIPSPVERFNRFCRPYCVSLEAILKTDLRFNRVKGALSVLPSTLQALLQAKVSLDRLAAYMNQPEIDPPMDESEGRIICKDATIGWPGEAIVEDIPQLASFTLKGLNFEPPQNQMTIVCGPLGSGKTLLVGDSSGTRLISATRATRRGSSIGRNRSCSQNIARCSAYQWWRDPAKLDQRIVVDRFGRLRPSTGLHPTRHD